MRLFGCDGETAARWPQSPLLCCCWHLCVVEPIVALLSAPLTLCAGCGCGARVQLVFAPTFVAVFFAAMAGVQGVPEEAAARLKAGWADAVVTNYKLWPAAQCVPIAVDA